MTRVFFSLVCIVVGLYGCTSSSVIAPNVSNNQAVLALLDKATNHSIQENYDHAELELERALRIEPRNAQLWYELAKVKLQQEQYVQAENLALRANSFAYNKNALRRDIWSLIAQVREAQNDFYGAKKATSKAKMY